LPIQFTDIEGLRIRYSDEGAGPSIVFLHGWGAGFEPYAPLLSHLAQTHRVVAPDLPGAGQSQEPDTPWDSNNYVGFILRLAAAAGLSDVSLMGHSHGGRVIIKLMSTEQNILRVNKIALLSAAGIRPKRGLHYYVRVYSYKIAKYLLGPFPNTKAKLTGKAGSADYRNASPVMRGTLSRLVSEDMKALLPAMHVPTLLIWGELDTATPLAHAKMMEQLIPDAGLVILPGASHWACMEQWPYCARILDAFL
jgi:pimeloyl-ACP methyl ester carboxylesterase